MSEASDRPQDAGRRHRRTGRPSAETASLLARYQETLRRELAWALDQLEPQAADPGLGLVDPGHKRVDIKERSALADYAIKLGRELGSAIEPEDPKAPTAGTPARPRRKRAVDYG